MQSLWLPRHKMHEESYAQEENRQATSDVGDVVEGL